MRILSIVLALAAAAALPPVGAQTIYRCGNAYSDQPCGASAQVLAAPPVNIVPPDVPADLWAYESAYVRRWGVPLRYEVPLSYSHPRHRWYRGGGYRSRRD